MGFEQELRAYLERVEREPSVEAPVRHIDEHELHRHFLAQLHTMEQAGEKAAVRQLFHEWPNQLPNFARYLESLPPALAPVERQDASAFACRALDAAMGNLDHDVALVDLGGARFVIEVPEASPE